MTIRQVRKLLFAVDNQEMAVKELRRMLWLAVDQDVELTQNELERMERIYKDAKENES